MVPLLYPPPIDYTIYMCVCINPTRQIRAAFDPRCIPANLSSKSLGSASPGERLGIQRG